MTRTMPPEAPMMIGWSKGIAFQFSLPSRFIFPPSMTSDFCGTSRRRTAFQRPGGYRTDHARRRESDRRADGDRQVVDARDPCVWVNEQPFPVERGDLDPQRLHGGCDRFTRAQVV